ncbi:membrane protein [Candidatus Magnetoovum chiemensis]|nr:membrane protein [Candidatus Magnetoovum chiemensis]
MVEWGRRKQVIDRRQKTDAVLRIIWILRYACWLLILIALYILSQASPQVYSFSPKWIGNVYRKYWEIELVKGSFSIFSLALILSTIGLFLNFLRLKRGGDRLSPSLIIIFLFSFITMIVLFVKFL